MFLSCRSPRPVSPQPKTSAINHPYGPTSTSTTYEERVLRSTFFYGSLGHREPWCGHHRDFRLTFSRHKSRLHAPVNRGEQSRQGNGSSLINLLPRPAIHVPRVVAAGRMSWVKVGKFMEGRDVRASGGEEALPGTGAAMLLVVRSVRSQSSKLAPAVFCVFPLFPFLRGSTGAHIGQ